ncbi:MAG: hypothetical protein JST67_06110 [Bacteroidetes bacterium]|nr:hypothetical protein [Bacteroidota bacterium]
MKKSVLALAMAFGVSSAFAQDLTSKKGEPILPEKGDWALSVDATPFLGYIGNFFGKTANNSAPTFNFLGNRSVIMGKYFLDEKTAIRVGVNLGLNSQTVKNNVTQDNYTPVTDQLPPVVTDKSNFTTFGLGLTGGIEKRKGKTRLQGYYGAEAGIYVQTQGQSNTYGNAMANSTAAGNSLTPNSTTWASAQTDAAAGIPTYTGNGPAGTRVTSDKLGTSFQFGVRGFIGAEFFVLPKMSVGGEFGWGIGFQTTGSGTQTTQLMNSAGTQAITQSVSTAGSSSFVFGTDNRNSFFGPTGALRLNFYF